MKKRKLTKREKRILRWISKGFTLEGGSFGPLKHYASRLKKKAESN